MKRNYLLITSLIGLVTLTGCHYAPTTAKYNGVTYQNGWYQYASNGALLYPCGLLPSSEEPLFNKRKYNFWFTDKFSFDILYAEYEDSQFWKPNVYIAKDKVEEAKAFYQDKTNYNYYLSIRFKDESEVLIENEEEKAIVLVAFF